MSFKLKVFWLIDNACIGMREGAVMTGACWDKSSVCGSYSVHTPIEKLRVVSCGISVFSEVPDVNMVTALLEYFN